MNVLALLLLTQVSTPTEALNWALTHQLSIPASERAFKRYIWIPPWYEDPVKTGSAINFAVNTAANHSSIPVIPERIANNRMLVYDLQVLAPPKDKFYRLRSTWDGLAANEPYFHVTQNNSGSKKPYLAPHLHPTNADLLSQLTVSPALVYRCDWFLKRLLDTHYYEFMQWTHKDNTLFTLKEVAATVGVDFDKSIRLNADQRVAIAVSGVSESVRRIDRYQGIGGRENTGVFFATWDTKKDKSNIKNNPLYNLRTFFPDGGEAIFERQNGTHGFIIYDKTQRLVRAGDTALVNDYLVPGAHNKAIKPAIGCIRCHGQHSGLWPAPNHIKMLVDKRELDIRTDLNDPRAQSNAQLAGQYLGDFSRRIRLARDDYNRVSRQLTVHQQLDTGLSVEEVSNEVANIYAGYVYESVTPKQALMELGANVLPRQQHARNVTMALLRINVPVRRESWEEVFASARLLSQGANK